MKWKATFGIQAPATLNFPAFAPIISDAFEHLKCLPAGIDVGAGVFVVEQGLHPAAIYLLRQGLVKLVYITPDGRETMLGLRAAGWYAGAVSSLMHTPSLYSVRTVTPCVFSAIAAQEFSGKLMQSARLMRHFMDTLCNELISQSAEAQLRLIPAEQRLAHFMAERCIQNPQCQTLDPLPLLKQMELAQLLAITPEHLSRLLRKTSISQPTDHYESSIENQLISTPDWVTNLQKLAISPNLDVS